MIVQFLLDVASLWVSGFMTMIPPLPGWYITAVGQYSNGVDTLITAAAPWGFIVPWLTFVTVIQWWLGFLTFYIGVQLVKFVLWLMGR